MEKHIEFTLESAYYGGDKLGYDLIFRFDFEGTITINGVPTLLPVSTALIKPKFDKQRNMAKKMPAKIYALQPSTMAGGYVNAVCHIHVIELDKIGDYGDGAVLPITFDVHHVEETHYELEVPVVSHGGDHGKIALFLMKFKLSMKA
jgi:hypothetical protein